jgi:hypothetical protein
MTHGEDLGLYTKKIGDAGVMLIAKELATNTTMQHLYLSETESAATALLHSRMPWHKQNIEGTGAGSQ